MLCQIEAVKILPLFNVLEGGLRFIFYVTYCVLSFTNFTKDKYILNLKNQQVILFLPPVFLVLILYLPSILAAKIVSLHFPHLLPIKFDTNCRFYLLTSSICWCRKYLLIGIIRYLNFQSIIRSSEWKWQLRSMLFGLVTTIR